MLLFSRSFTLKKVLDLCLLVFFNFFSWKRIVFLPDTPDKTASLKRQKKRRLLTWKPAGFFFLHLFFEAEAFVSVPSR